MYKLWRRSCCLAGRKSLAAMAKINGSGSDGGKLGSKWSGVYGRGSGKGPPDIGDWGGNRGEKRKGGFLHRCSWGRCGGDQCASAPACTGD
ncbi:hypothetical protein BGX38DRAFT_1180646, partial [Terfezia claveryi]